MKPSSKFKSSLVGLLLVITSFSTQSAPSSPLFQNSLWWFATPNPSPPISPLIKSFEPLASSPSFYRWYSDLNFEACVLGISPRAGPYGSETMGVTSSGCGEIVANNPAEQQPTGNANVAIDNASGGLTNAALIAAGLAAAAALAAALSSDGGGSTGTTGTTGTR